ncbi:hypothetical protein ZIOFF_034165 [Zingiber officinale]|uniref:Kinesin motor domain-containing protein n=1 Tax=Zingiber officinale TaxID=94328 RepID=A0A8J5GKJ2_ZINOF|nr:hypothetical protein ZIOFF_034165 [Zingiber officinale]
MVLQLENFGLDTSSPSVVYMDVNVVPEHDGEALLASTISALQAEVKELLAKQIFLDAKRREALNRILDIKGSIRVFCRVKLRNEKKALPISIEADKITVRPLGTCKDCIVDRVFPPESTQDDVFQEVRPILRSALDGHNVCVLAYGQTGTGKTHTMEGRNGQQGIVPRAIEELFHQISQDKSAKFRLSMSMLEVYMGSLRDLFVHRPYSSARSTYLIPKSNLSILSGADGTIEIEGLMDVPMSDAKQAYRWYARGKHARSTSWTHVNDASSRSHWSVTWLLCVCSLTRITICRLSNDTAKGAVEQVSKLWLVDLGGSERLLKTGAKGQTLDEGRSINLSLSALGDVIAALRMKRNHIPYRNSKVTQILSDSLGDGSKVLMIVHISASEEDIGETICSLTFAKRVRAVDSSRELSEESKKRKEQCINELEQQIQESEDELKKVRSQIEKTERLIREKTKLHQVPSDMNNGSPRSTLILDVEEEKPIQRSQTRAAPGFMSSTECSRQRQKLAVSTTKWRSMSASTRKPLDFLGPQTLSFSSLPKKRNMACKPSDHLNMSQNSIDSRGSTASRAKKVSNSNPNLMVALHKHRRRMSALL